MLQGLEMVSREQGGRDYPRHFLAGAFCFQPIAVAGGPPQFKRDRVERLRNERRDCRRPRHRLDIEDCKDPEGFGNSLGEFHRLYGNTGANSLVGGRGNDVISGNSGSDLIYGGIGADRTYGGSGADRFVFKALGESAGSLFDSIFDFAPSSGDRIDLSAIDASTKFSGN